MVTLNLARHSLLVLVGMRSDMLSHLLGSLDGCLRKPFSRSWKFKEHINEMASNEQLIIEDLPSAHLGSMAAQLW